MNSKQKYAGFVEMGMGTCMDMFFYCVMILYFFVLSLVGNDIVNKISVEFFSFLHIILQTVWMLAYILIIYALGEIGELSNKFTLVKTIAIINSILSIGMMVIVNTYNIWVLNNKPVTDTLFIYSNIVILAINLALFFTINGIGTYQYVDGTKEVLYKYGADASYQKTCDIIMKSIKYLSVVIVACVVVIGIVFGKSDISSMAIAKGIKWGGNLSPENMVANAFWFIAVIVVIIRAGLQVSIIKITRKTYKHVKSISE